MALAVVLLGGLATASLAAEYHAPFDDSWGYSYCYPEADCTHAASSDLAAGSMTLASSASSPDGGTTPGSARSFGAQELIGEGWVDEPTGSLVVTVGLHLDRAEATTTGDGSVDSMLRVSAAIEDCAGSGCIGGAQAGLVGTAAGVQSSRTGEDVTMQFALTQHGGGDLPPGRVIFKAGVDGGVVVGENGPAAGSGTLDVHVHVLSVTIEPGTLLVATEVESEQSYVGGGTYRGPTTPSLCATAPVPQPGEVCFAVPHGATQVRVAVHDEVTPSAGGVLRGNLAPGISDAAFCGESPPMRVHPGSGEVVVFLDGPHALDRGCGMPVTGKVVATFTVWVAVDPAG